ncbi:hypothetical protein [Sphingomonas sp. GC_Shp_3]|uniref:hypothetical protein n=1 Tax=Sphingomonas sp. GC_Shp_3 TaxID=2937383 RepID=UPI00226A26B6|nr:hypothetical protein [Sphingomonas sp. GC_Shp_3]
MAVLPAAVIGFLSLNDGIGPQGWRGLAELFGWFIACMVVAKCLALLLMRGGQNGVPAYALALTAVAGIGALTYELLNWLGLDAPMSAKIVFTSSMQVLGAIGAALSSLLIARTVWNDVRR